MVSKILPAALDADTFAISSTRPSAAFLAKCTLLDQADGDATGASVVAIVDRTANVSQAASTIGSSRISFKGKSSYAPDIVLVNEFVADDFIFHLVRAVTSKETPPISQYPSKTHSDSDPSVLKEAEDNEGCRLVNSGANGRIIEITDR